MTTVTYWVHVNQEGQPVGPRAKFLGTPRYGYNKLGYAKLNCPVGAGVQERHHEDEDDDDWAGNIVWWHGWI